MEASDLQLRNNIMSRHDLTEMNCLVPVRNPLAKASNTALTPCGRRAVMVGRWPKKRNEHGQIETVLVALCKTCGAQNAAAKWDSMAPAHCYTDDEIDLLAKSGLYVERDGANPNKLDSAIGLVRYKAQIAVNRIKSMIARASE